MRKHDEEFLANLRSHVERSFRSNARLFVAEIKEKSGNHGWEIAQMILTIALGGLLWSAETHITNRIDSEHAQLSTKLVLTQEFYKQKFVVYTSFYKQLTALVDDLHNAQLDQQSNPKNGADKTAATNDITNLNEFMRDNGFYLSEQVKRDLQEVWRIAGDLPVVNKPGYSTMGQLNAAVAQAQSDMQIEATGAMAALK